MSALFEFLNHTSRVLLDLDPDSKEGLIELEGKILCIKITVPAITLFLRASNGELEILQQCETEADVTLTGSAMAFARLGNEGAASGVLSDGQVNMKGGTLAWFAVQGNTAVMALHNTMHNG